jgi:hypothetical protein
MIYFEDNDLLQSWSFINVAARPYDSRRIETKKTHKKTTRKSKKHPKQEENKKKHPKQEENKKNTLNKKKIEKTP